MILVVGLRIAAVSVVGLCLVGAAVAADIPSCADFRERLTRAEGVLGGIVSRFEFREIDTSTAAASKDKPFSVENVRGLSGELNCRRDNDAFSDLQIFIDVSGQPRAEDMLAVGRFISAMRAMTWAYTQWPKRKVDSIVGRLTDQATREVKKSELRGDTIVQGKAELNVNDSSTLTYSLGAGGVTFMIDASAAEAQEPLKRH